MSPRNRLFTNTQSTVLATINKQNDSWFALRITYSRELLLKKYFDEQGIECFVPMHCVDIEKDGQLVRKQLPIIHNLVFARTTRLRIDGIKTLMEARLPIRYIMDKSTHSPIIVPKKQMEDFITVSSTCDEKLVYLNPDEIDLKKGDKVRVLGGIFKGAEGVLLRIKGNKRVVVSIPGVMAVATAYIHPSMLEKIENA